MRRAPYPYGKRAPYPCGKGGSTLTKAIGLAERYRTANGTSAQLKKTAGYLCKHVNR
ncbi:hypothetical protein AB0G15_36010 [Streptosporangium sp. NPDC023825]|uniref:hypothetical protein n=1 Tax=Streptosporangium sp. NPDC023825 TaxID=3154909 RepID=UPI00343B023D